MDPEHGNSDLSSENTTDQSDLDLSCSSSFDNSDAVEEPELGTVESYQYEPIASDVISTSDGEDSDGGDEGDPSRLSSTDWCQCGKCQIMPTARECVCCEIEKIDEKKAESLSGREVACITDQEGFEPVCLNMWVLQAAYSAYRYHYGDLEEVTHKRYRFIAYHQLTGWCWGWLGRRVRVVLPSCAVMIIRTTFPSPEYAGFKYPDT